MRENILNISGRFNQSLKIKVRETICNERGIALAVVLILAAISLAIMAALVFMLTSGTQISGAQKRYKTALEAGRAGAEVTLQMIAARGNPGLTGITIDLPASDVGGVDCLLDKLTKSTAAWDPVCSTASTIDPALATSYDMVFDLGSIPTFRVYTKIADTIEGNSAGDLGLIKSGVVNSTGEVVVMSKPYLYTIEVDAENKDNPSERAKYSILYQY